MSDQLTQIVDDLVALDPEVLLAESRQAGEKAVILRRMAETAKAIRALRGKGARPKKLTPAGAVP